MCFLRFNKYKVKHIVVYNGVIWTELNKNYFLDQVLWGHLGHFDPDSNFHNYYNLNCELIP